MPVEIVSQIAATADHLAQPTQSFAANPSTLKTQLRKQPSQTDKSARSRLSLFPWLLGLLTLLGAAGLLLIWLFPSLGIRLFPAIENTAVPSASPTSSAPRPDGLASPSPSSPNGAAYPFLTTQSRVLVSSSASSVPTRVPATVSACQRSRIESAFITPDCHSGWDCIGSGCGASAIGSALATA